VNPEYVKIKEAAAFCGLSVAGYRAAMRKGKLPRPVRGMRIYSLNAIKIALGQIPATILPPSDSDEAFYRDIRRTRGNGDTYPRRQPRKEAA